MKQWQKDGRLYLVIAFAVMAILFYSSSQTYAQQSQIGLLERVLKNQPFLDQLQTISFVYAGKEISIAADGYFSFVEFFIRKGAHFGTYLVMGGSLFLGLLPRMKSYPLTAVVAWLAAVGYAGLDEFHQMITGGRTPLFQDVMLDASGAGTAIILCMIWSFIRKRRTF